MEKIATILANTEFESSSGKTAQFKSFVSEFKKEFKKEMSRVGAKDIVFHVGHFDISGFFNKDGQLYYFSVGDIRGSNYKREESLMYRTAQHLKDWTGGYNQWVVIGRGMADNMRI